MSTLFCATRAILAVLELPPVHCEAGSSRRSVENEHAGTKQSVFVQPDLSACSSVPFDNSIPQNNRVIAEVAQ
jgi:hypothetical protein